VIDIVDNEAEEEPRLRRRFHLGSAVNLTESGRGAWSLTVGARTIGTLHDLSGGNHYNTTARMVRGQRDPEPQGFTFPSNREWEENWTLELDSPADLEVLCTAFSLGSVSPATPPPQFAFQMTAGDSDDNGVLFDVTVGHDDSPFSVRIASPSADGRMRVTVS